MNIRKNAEHKKNEVSFESIYSKYYSSVLFYFIKRIRNQSDAEDLTSEVFLYCFNNYDTYDSSKSSFATWLYLVAKSRFYNYCRDKKQTEDIDDYANIIEDTSNLVEKAVYLSELRMQLNVALNELTERQKKIVVMKYFEGMCAEEIANILNTNANNVRVQLSKALKRLQTIIENLEGR